MKAPASIPLTPLAVMAGAQGLVGFEDIIAGRGPWLRMILRQVGLPRSAPWSAAFAWHVGFCAHAVTELGYSTWPLPRTGDGDELAAFGRDRGIAHDTPEWADIALFWDPKECQYSRVGFVVGLAPRGKRGELRLTTIQGNVAHRTGKVGNGVHRIEQVLRPDSQAVFLRWVELDGRQDRADGTHEEQASPRERAPRRSTPAHTDPPAPQ